MRPHASLGALLTLAACGTPSAPPVAPDAPAEPRTWLGRVAHGPGAGLPDGRPLCAKMQAVAEWNREAARLEAGAAALPILRRHPGAAAWSPRAWRMIAFLHAQTPEAGADLAAQVAEAMAELAALRAAAPGADEDRVAGNRWHLPAAPALAAARPRMSEDARRWTDSLTPDGIPVVILSLVERMRQADGAENERRQHVLLLAIAGIAPAEPPAETPSADTVASSAAGAAPTPSTSAPPALAPTPDAPPARRPAPMSSVPNAYPPQASAPAPEMPAPDGRTEAPAPDRTASP
jgi:hypothetical protein